MRLEDIAPDVRNRAFEFFYWFSRFEFALKENRFLKNQTPGSRAEPGWDQFVEKYEAAYNLSAAGSQLVDEAPQRQIVGQHRLEFIPVGFDDQPAELEKVVRLLKTVRNNLFHGGKHGVEGWDDPGRTVLLMSLCIDILDELAELAGIEADYKRYY
ncbi:hypothetical protein [Rhodovulum sp. YEN HP10]|uniref:hypothetical protein n=1 Tax=Rhodovulum sp. HP10 TaxID=3387397 RepID=UPI0039DFA50C